jgi:hypothetical protein
MAPVISDRKIAARFRGRLSKDQGAARMIEDYYDFQWVLMFEQSVNHRRGPRSWPQIGAAATWLLKRGCDVAF